MASTGSDVKKEGKKKDESIVESSNEQKSSSVAAAASLTKDALMIRHRIVSHTTNFEAVQSILNDGVQLKSNSTNRFDCQTFYVAEDGNSIHAVSGKYTLTFGMSNKTKIYDIAESKIKRYGSSAFSAGNEFTEAVRNDGYDAIKYKNSYKGSNFAIIRNPHYLTITGVYPTPAGAQPARLAPGRSRPVIMTSRGFTQVRPTSATTSSVPLPDTAISLSTIKTMQVLGTVGTGYALYHAGRLVAASDNPYIESQHQATLWTTASQVGMAAGRAAIPFCALVGEAFPPAAWISVPACIAGASTVGGAIAVIGSEVILQTIDRGLKASGDNTPKKVTSISTNLNDSTQLECTVATFGNENNSANVGKCTIEKRTSGGVESPLLLTSSDVAVAGGVVPRNAKEREQRERLEKAGGVLGVIAEGVISHRESNTQGAAEANQAPRRWFGKAMLNVRDPDRGVDFGSVLTGAGDYLTQKLQSNPGDNIPDKVAFIDANRHDSTKLRCTASTFGHEKSSATIGKCTIEKRTLDDAQSSHPLISRDAASVDSSLSTQTAEIVPNNIKHVTAIGVAAYEYSRAVLVEFAKRGGVLQLPMAHITTTKRVVGPTIERAIDSAVDDFRTFQATKTGTTVSNAVVVIEQFSQAAVLGVAQEVGHTVEGLKESILHPLDRVIYPMSLLLSDAMFISAGHHNTSTYSPDFPEIEAARQAIINNPRLYLAAVDRMEQRLNHLRVAGQKFIGASWQEEVRMASRVLTSMGINIYAPGVVINTTKAMVNVYRIGVPLRPSSFHNWTGEAPTAIPSGWLEILSSSQKRVRETPGQKFYDFVITEDSKLIFSETGLVGFNGKAIRPLDLAEGRPVLSAGIAYFENGLVKQIGIFCDEYLVHGPFIGKFTEQFFKKQGFKEAPGKFMELTPASHYSTNKSAIKTSNSNLSVLPPAGVAIGLLHMVAGSVTFANLKEQAPRDQLGQASGVFSVIRDRSRLKEREQRKQLAEAGGVLGIITEGLRAQYAKEKQARNKTSSLVAVPLENQDENQNSNDFIPRVGFDMGKFKDDKGQIVYRGDSSRSPQSFFSSASSVKNETHTNKKSISALNSEIPRVSDPTVLYLAMQHHQVNPMTPHQLALHDSGIARLQNNLANLRDINHPSSRTPSQAVSPYSSSPQQLLQNLRDLESSRDHFHYSLTASCSYQNSFTQASRPTYYFGSAVEAARYTSFFSHYISGDFRETPPPSPSFHSSFWPQGSSYSDHGGKSRSDPRFGNCDSGRDNCRDSSSSTCKSTLF